MFRSLSVQKLWLSLALLTFSLHPAQTPAINILYWNGEPGATWNDAANWTYYDTDPEEFGPGIIPNANVIPHFDNFGPGSFIGLLGANQSVLGLSFDDLTAPFILGDLAEPFTLTIGVSGITLADTIAPGGSANAIINSNLLISGIQTWANQTPATLAALGNITLEGNPTLTDEPGSATFNSGGTFILGSAGKTITQSLANRTITVQDTGADTELIINGELALTESAGTGRRLTIATTADAAVIINGNITNGAGGASGFTKTGAGTMTINGDISYTSANGTVLDGGTLFINGAAQTAGGAYAANNGSTLHFNSTNYTGNGTFTANGSTINFNASSYGGTSAFAVTNGGVFNLQSTSYTGTGIWTIASGELNVTTGNTTLNINSLTLGQSTAPAAANLNASGYTFNLTSSITVRYLSTPVTLDNDFVFLNTNHNIEVWGDPSQELVITGNITQNTPGSGFTKTRGGTLVLAGTNTLSGENFFGHGSVVLDFTTNNTSKLGSGAQNLGGVDLILSGNHSAATVQEVSALNVFARGSSNVIFNPGVGQTLTLKSNTLVRGSGDGGIAGTINFVLPNDNAQVEIASADTPFVAGWATIEDASSSYFAAISGGRLVKATPPTPNDLLAGQWAPTLINQNITASTGFVGTTDNMDINSLRVTGGNPLNIIENLHVASGGILNAKDSTSAGIFGGSITSGLIPGTLGAELVITQHSNTDFEIQSSIRRANDSAGGAVNITKAGTGTLVLSGRNQTSGRTNSTVSSGSLFINEGTVVLKGGNALSDNTAVIFDPRGNAVLRLADDETIGNLSSNGVGLDGEGTVDVGTHKLTIKQSGTQTYSGAFTGSGTIVKDNLDASATSLATLVLNSTSNDNFTGDLHINRGLIQLSGNGVLNLGNVREVRINQGGGLIIDHTDATIILNRLSNSADIVLNGANGRSAAGAAMRGLNIRSNQGNIQIETIRNLVINSGANYVTLEALATSTSSATVIQAESITRNGAATLSVRGTNLAGTGGRTRLRLASNSAAAVAFANQFRAGGIYANGASVLATTGASNNGASTAKDISIVPWAVGETFTTSTPGATNDGNSFVAYNSDDLGFTPLHLTNQYSTYTAAASTHNVRESLIADLAMGAGKNINSLLINNQNNGASAASPGALVTLTGTAGSTLSVTSGAFLFTGVGAVSSGLAAQNANQGGIVVRGFDGIAVSGINKEYIMFANNLSTAGTTIESNLITAATFTKSGQGLLHLKGANDAITNVTINEGILRIDNASNMGGNDGSINLAGGTLQLSTAWDSATSGSIANRTIHVLEDTISSIDTNASSRTDRSNDLTIGALTGSGILIKQGLGTLILGGDVASTFTGIFVVEGAATLEQDDAGVILNNSGGNAIAGDIIIGKLNSAPPGRAVLRLGRSDQIADTSVITFLNPSGNNGFFNLNGYNETVAGIVSHNGEGVIQVTQGATPGGGNISTLTLAGSGDYFYQGYLRNASGFSGAVLNLVKTGSGTQTLSGDRVSYSGTTVINGGLLRLRDAINFNSVVTNDADLELETTVSNWNYTRAINGSGNLKKTGTGTTTLSAVSNYSGTTDIDSGTLTLTAAGSINNSRAINIKHSATFNVSAKGTSGYSYGHILSGGGTVNGSINLTTGGSIRPGASSGPSVDATTGDQLGALTITGNFGLVGGSARLQISAATLNDAGVAAAFTAGGATFTDYLSNNASTWDSTAYTDANGVPKHDYIDISGTLTWNGGSIISYTANTGYNPSVGDILNLWDWTTLNGTYQLNPDTLGINSNYQRGGGLIGDLELPNFDGILYDLSLFESHGIAVVVMIPEPSKGILLLLGLSALLLRRRRQGTA
jgi:fibronectin-binding autotransporter adhesin